MTDDPAKPSGGGPVFFLSYARPSVSERVQGDPDRDFAAFYYDLCAALTRFAPLDRLHSLGAVSGEWNGPGGSRATDPAKDIAECDVFVPLHQERYFQNEQCGRELAAFEARVRLAGTPRADAILPVLWAPVPPQWAAAQPAPYRTGQADVDDEYLNKGLFWLQGAYPARYRQVVEGLARRVTEIAAGRTVGRVAAADLAHVQSSLRQADRQPLVVVLLAPTRHRPREATDRQFGPAITDWAPFSGETSQPLADILVELARHKGWEPRVVPFSTEDERLFGDSEPDSQVVLVVNPLVVDDDTWRAALRRFDRIDKPWIGVVVAWDPTGVPDGELHRLRAELQRVLDRKFARRSPSLRINAPIATSLQSFDLALDATANHTRIQLANHLLSPASDPAEEENHT
ncbi:FxsC protein [Catenulispora pinisilvae]|uniref:FxsC protein n=1 Tax=Catenulispora pinisilvae TaxID=2705253 RepID=UPI00189202D8|nr:FxsC protein [Catenulispora pinisilvae]